MILALLGMLLGGCAGGRNACESGDDTCREVDTSAYTGETYVRSVDWDCNETHYWYTVTTVGLTAGGRLRIVGPMGDANWLEGHDLTSLDADEWGHWEELYIRLEILDEDDCSRDSSAENACWRYWKSGVHTLWTCDPDDTENMTWAVTVYEDQDGTLVEDCVAWGDDITKFSGCTWLG